MRKLLVSFFVWLVLVGSSSAHSTNQIQTVDNLPLPKSHELADDIAKLSPVRYLPGHPLFIFVTLKEKLQRFIEPSAKDKAHFDAVLAGKNIKEAYLLVEKKNYSSAKGAIESYGSRMESLAQELSRAQNQGQDVVKTLNLLVDHLGKHQDLMAQILFVVPSEQKESFKLALQFPNEKLLQVIELLEKGRPDQAERLFNRYSVATESAKP